MRALVVYCHPNPESYCAHLRDTVLAALRTRGAQHRLIDLYGEGFDPVMGLDERLGYHAEGANEIPVADALAHLRWSDTLIFVYPTWWFNVPAMLKGWLDRVLVPHATFALPDENGPFRPRLHNITTIAAITTAGARRWHSKFIGEPGRKTLLRGLRFICHPKCKTRYVALYEIDTSTHAARVRYASDVEAAVLAL